MNRSVAAESSKQTDIETFIKRWTDRTGGAERANYALFLVELCDLIGVGRPDPAGEDTERNEYVFERAVRFRHDDGSTSPGRIDLYKKGCFVLEAKQSKKREKGGEVYEQLAFALESGHGGGTAVLERPRAKAKRQTQLSTWDALMRSARKQAENYARALDEWPPFLVIVDVGHAIELYADFSRQGKNYAQFPDRNSFRITMDGMRSPDIRARLKAVWEDPFSLDPAKRAAEVTQDIAALLAKMTQTMERRAPSDDPTLKGEWAFKVSKFLMRCIFAMFAEDVGLLPKGAFLKLIEQHKGKANRFHFAANDFFTTMDRGGYSPAVQQDIKKFNGGLFHDAISVEITEDELTLLEKAARRDWHAVEPAIFGTLLEQALTERERSKLGAHYTPRAYVERLVVPTIIEPLREDWDIVQSEAIGKLLEGDEKGAREAVKKFHDQLCDTRVLDPACGTGNFLYVSMELMKRLEGEVLDFLKELGETTEPLRTVDPHQFLGIELNPRAVPIAELVLWIGYIQWWFRTRERQVIAEPILKDFGTVKEGDAVLAFDKQELLRDEHGKPITRQDPRAVKLHPITGEEIPDPDAKLPIYRYINPRPAKWPAAEFVLGNPPFIPNREFRLQFGDGYVAAIRRAFPAFTQAADFVLFFWLQATGSKTFPRQIGFISTSRLRMTQNNAVFRNALKRGWEIEFAIPDHDWPDGPQHAAVRVCFITISKRAQAPRLVFAPDHNLVKSRASKSLTGYVERQVTLINPDLSDDIDVNTLSDLSANAYLCHAGVKPYSRKLHIDGKLRNVLFASKDREKYAPMIFNGHDVGQHWRGFYVLDFFGLSEDDLRIRQPRAYQYVLDYVKPERAAERNERLRREFWLFEANRVEMRDALSHLKRFIVTLENSPQRYFVFIDGSVLPDQKLRVLASDDAFHLGVLSSTFHEVFSLRVGGRAGKANTPVYNTNCLIKFPFPFAAESERERIRSLAEELDALRRKVLEGHDFLTMTTLYNVREKLKSSTPLDDSEKAIHDAGCVGVIHELHNKIDAVVAEAYGWPAGLSDEEILGRLVALNKERAEEERRGIIRWLRPDYQAARVKAPAEKEEQIEADLELPEAAAPELPRDDAALVATLRQTLRVIGKPAEAKDIAGRFRDGARASRRVERGLQLLAAAGVVRRSTAGWFLPTDRAT